MCAFMYIVPVDDFLLCVLMPEQGGLFNNTNIPDIHPGLPLLLFCAWACCIACN